jgi:hypothetical protein
MSALNGSRLVIPGGAELVPFGWYIISAPSYKRSRRVGIRTRCGTIYGRRLFRCLGKHDCHTTVKFINIFDTNDMYLNSRIKMEINVTRSHSHLSAHQLGR